MTRKSMRSRRLFPAPPKVAKNNLLDSLGVTAVNYKDTARLRMFILRARQNPLPPGHRFDRPTAAPNRHGDQERSRDVPFAVPVIRRAVTRMCAPLWRQVVHDGG